MEISRLFGLPAHPLLVHLPVVLVPIAGLMALAFAIRPAWLDRFGWWLVAVSGVGALGALLAAGSGEALEGQVERTEVLHEHAEMGQVAEVLAVIFFAVVLVVVLLRRYSVRHEGTAGLRGFVRSRAGGILLSLALVAGAAAATVTVAQAGHQGAKATWQDEDDNKGQDSGNHEDEGNHGDDGDDG